MVRLDGDVETSGTTLAAPPALLALFSSFLGWQPIAPRSAKQLAQISARLCRLLREEVTEELERNNPGLTSLAGEWRNLLFPEASDEQFADGYAQAVTFGLLVARVRNIDLSKGLDTAANELRKTSTLIGTALRLLVDDENIKKALKTSLDTLRRVLNVVDWPTISKGDPEAWLYFYEDFLEVYDNAAQADRLLLHAARGRERDGAARRRGAARSQAVQPARGAGRADGDDLRSGRRHRHLPARRAAPDRRDRRERPGRRRRRAGHRGRVTRIFAFEMQFGPFAVAQLRLIAEMQSLIGTAAARAPTPKLYVTDTLGDPYATETQFSAMVAPIGESRKEANKIKREKPITVVIGNPPYKEKAKGRGGWIESGSDVNEKLRGADGPLDAAAGLGRRRARQAPEESLRLFLALGDAEGLRLGLVRGDRRARQDRSGIVCFITVAGFLNGPGFQKMRDDLRRDCAAIWVIDCSPEGHQPEVNTRIFQGVQQPVCIVLAARTPNKDRENARAAEVHGAAGRASRAGEVRGAGQALAEGDRKWVDGPTDWRDPFLPEQRAWATFPPLAEVIRYGRLWRDAGTNMGDCTGCSDRLRARWRRTSDEKNRRAKGSLVSSADCVKDKLAKPSHRQSGSREPWQASATRPVSVADDQRPLVAASPLRISIV